MVVSPAFDGDCDPSEDCAKVIDSVAVRKRPVNNRQKIFVAGRIENSFDQKALGGGKESVSQCDCFFGEPDVVETSLIWSREIQLTKLTIRLDWTYPRVFDTLKFVWQRPTRVSHHLIGQLDSHFVPRTSLKLSRTEIQSSKARFYVNGRRHADHCLPQWRQPPAFMSRRTLLTQHVRSRL